MIYTRFSSVNYLIIATFFDILIVVLYYILFNNYYTPEEAVIIFLITIFVFFISLSIHEFAHAYSAYKMGDDTAKLAGRLTLNPFKHLSMSGTLFFILFGIGWAKPTPVNPLKFKKYRAGIRWVSSAGVLSNFLLGLLSAGIYAILYHTVGASNVAMEYVLLILQYFMLVNSYLALFNILPIYPLDGFNFITSFMRADNKFIHFSVKNSNIIIICVLVISLILEVFIGVDILSWYLSIIYNYIYLPIIFLGV